jgi:hypothetical protein
MSASRTLFAAAFLVIPGISTATETFVAVGTIEKEYVGYTLGETDGLTYTERSKAYFIGVGGDLAVVEYGRSAAARILTFYSFLGSIGQSDLGRKQRIVTNLTGMLPKLSKPEDSATVMLRYEAHLGRSELILRGTVVTRDTPRPPVITTSVGIPSGYGPFVGHGSRTFKFAAAKDVRLSALVADSKTLAEAVLSSVHVLLGWPDPIPLSYSEQWGAAVSNN